MPPSDTRPPGATPRTLRQVHVDLIHGQEVADPYRWLEDEGDPQVQAWTAEQDEHARSVLQALSARVHFRQRARRLLNVGSVGTPVPRGGRLFFVRHRPGENQPLLRVRRGSRELTVLDPNRLSVDGTVALDWWYPSPNGRLVAFGLSAGGDEQSVLGVRRVDDGQDLPDRLLRTRAASIAWLPDSSGFYYTRYPLPGEVTTGDEQYHRRVLFHSLGDEQAQDPEVFAPPEKEAWPHVALSPDGRWLLIVIAHGWARSDVYLLDRERPAQNPVCVVRGVEAWFDGEVVGDVLYLRTNEQAPNYRLLAVDPLNPSPDRWREIVAEAPNALSGFAVVAGRLALHYLQNATSSLELRDLDGTYQERVALPGTGSLTGLEGEPAGEMLYFGYTSFATPSAGYSYRPGAGSASMVAAPRVPGWLQELPLRVDQVWYSSRDGTRVSMFVLSRQDRPCEVPRPTLLTGYGGFNVSRTPAFAPGAISWVEAGGVWALPNLRGGGEYGEAWHRAGMRECKQNVFDDFAAAAEWLIDSGYTAPDRLAISGGSNGGLLVGAALTQRPELFRAVACAVPLLDMLRYHRFRIARLWIPEYGSAEDAEQFRWLLAYSPYHRVRSGACYPAVLLTTGEQDSRVDPLHARKMAALLQAESGSGLPVLLRVERQAGHGAGKPIEKLVEEQSDVLAFLAWQTGLDEHPGRRPTALRRPRPERRRTPPPG